MPAGAALPGAVKPSRHPWIGILFEARQKEQNNEEIKKDAAVRVYSHAYNSIKDRRQADF